MKTLSLLATLLICCNLPAQDYLSCQRVFSRVDGDVFANDLPAAMQRIDSIYDAYDFIYARHCIKSLQICCKANDSLRAEKWLSRCFTQGVPVWVIRNNELMKKSFSFQNTLAVIGNYDSLHAIYERSYDHELRAELDSLIELDQARTKKVNEVFIPFRPGVYFRWKQNNKRQAERIREIIQEHGYPGERLIGLPQTIVDSAVNYKYLVRYGPNLGETSAYYMLIHYYSTPREDMNELLMKSLVLGYLPPEFYATWNDFMARYGRKKEGHLYYNQWHDDLETALHREAIDRRRHAIGLNTLEEKERNRSVLSERRKAGSSNSEVVLE